MSRVKTGDGQDLCVMYCESHPPVLCVSQLVKLVEGYYNL